MSSFDSQQIEIPSKIPVMTLPGAVLFPQVIMPLYIFEERYRSMLADVLAESRMFGILTRDENAPDSEDEAYHAMGTIGMVRTSHDNPDGTSNILLQGLTRFTVDEVVQEEPYRMVHINPVSTCRDEAPYPFLKERVLDLLKKKRGLGAKVPKDVTDFLSDLENEESFIEFASFTSTEDAMEKLELLELIQNRARFERLIEILERQNEDLLLYRKLRQGLRDDDIGLN
ncbi:MAG: LON peptidase substrate-binding domain-containing protein [Verrucomicrobiota bacterium]